MNKPFAAPNHIMDAPWSPANDDNLIREHKKLRSAFDQMVGGSRNPEFWDPENPRTAEEYHANSLRRQRAKSRRRTAHIQRLLIGSIVLFGVACVLALLVG